MSITRAFNETPVTGIGTSFDINKVIEVDMGMFPCDAPYRGYMSLILVQCSAISSATTVTIRICRDSAGDEMIITDTASQLFTGVSTATKGTAAFALNAFASLASTDKVFVFLKSNAGTFTSDFVEITWGAT